jgi:uncharacterized protein
METAIETFRNKGAKDLALAGIRLYQKTISKATPARCRLQPSCSQYGIEAIQIHGVQTGLAMTYARIKSCRPPKCGYDPVPTHLQISTKPADISREGLNKANFDNVVQKSVSIIPGYDHNFRMIVTYPKDREFYSKVDLKSKIREFNNCVLQTAQYAIRFQVDTVDAGIASSVYLLRLTGTLDGEYLEVKPDEVVSLIIVQLENFFTVVQKGEFKSIYFEVDGQVIYQPDSELIPVQERQRAWVYTSNQSFWDEYWDSYIISELIESVLDIASAVIDASSSLPDFADPNVDFPPLGLNPTPPGDLADVAGGFDLNPFDGDGCSIPDINFDGCDIPDLDLGGCDGCDGCDLGGCDFS